MRRVSNIRAGFTLAECAMHVAHCNNSRKQGFTLAEVLITLGIIGVVAALTLPSVVIKYREQSDEITWKQRYRHHHSTNEFALNSVKDQSEALFRI